MHRKRLLLLKDLVRAIPQEKLKMDIWWESDSCNTVGCVFGWAANSLLFPELSIVRSKDGPYLVTFEKENGTDAARSYFEITQRQVHHIFMPESYEDELELEENEYIEDASISKEYILNHIDNVLYAQTGRFL